MARGRPRGTGKYGNMITVRDGFRFHSKKEADRWDQLKLLERGKVIANLNRQVPFLLEVADKRICKLVIDFTYIEAGRKVAEDAKGFQTDVSKFKMSLAAALFPDWDWRIV